MQTYDIQIKINWSDSQWVVKIVELKNLGFFSRDLFLYRFQRGASHRCLSRTDEKYSDGKWSVLSFGDHAFQTFLPDPPGGANLETNLT